MNDYKKQAEEFLSKFGIKFEYENLGVEISRLDPKRRNYKYIASFIRPGKQVEFEFHGSIADWEAAEIGVRTKGSFGYYLKTDKGKRVLHAYDVLTCLTKDNPGTFSDFCSEWGYEEDSRKAFSTYEDVCEEWKKVSSFFSASEIEEMKEIQ